MSFSRAAVTTTALPVLLALLVLAVTPEVTAAVPVVVAAAAVLAALVVPVVADNSHSKFKCLQAAQGRPVYFPALLNRDPWRACASGPHAQAATALRHQEGRRLQRHVPAATRQQGRADSEAD
jgi:hypothetical protein